MADSEEGNGNHHRHRGRSRAQTYKGNNEGGYGNPPVKHQFRGQAGPGRPRGSGSFEAAMRKMFRSPVGATIGGVPTKISMADAMAGQLRNEIMAGNFKALELGMKLIEKFGPRDDPNEEHVFDLSALSRDQRLALRAFLTTMTKVDRNEVFRMLRRSKAVLEDRRKKGE